MKKLLIFVLVTVLVLVSISPALAGNGNGGGGGNGNGGNGGGNGGGNDNGRNGNNNNQQKLGTGENGYRLQFGINVVTGVITAIDADFGLIMLKVCGGKDISLYGSEVKVEIDSGTRLLSKQDGEITAIDFVDILVGDTASITIGSDGIAERITVGVDCLCVP